MPREVDECYIDGRLLFTHLRIPGESLDKSFLPLMSEKDVIRFLEYVPRFRELELYIETDVLLEFDGERRDSDVEWQDDRYHLVDEPEELKEIDDMFYELDQEMDKPDKVIKAEDVTNLSAVYYQAIDDERDVVLVEVVSEEMVAKEAVDGDDGKHVVSNEDVFPDDLYAAIVAQEGVFPANDRDVILHELYVAIVAQKGVFSSDDGDVIPYELYAEVFAQEGGGLVNYEDVMPYEVVVEEMLEDQTRSIKGRRVMADKKNDDDAQSTILCLLA
uniref:Uncharacterized protein n=1 Tax=Tanacetum cinerariifolium TaxID=118510 RepID=A0A6L2LUQ9_TANCI|nr:hypothetical protein [Tanacetum cinerariifolium]